MDNEAYKTKVIDLQEDVVFKDIENLAQDNPIVRAGLDLYNDNPHLSWSKILMIVVQALAAQNKDLRIQLLQAKVRSLEIIQMKDG